MVRKLPIGIQSFEKIRRDGYLYADKTELAYRLVSEGNPIFLSRPRRFGKSLLISTLRAYFEGRRELFEGLAIEGLEEAAADAEGRDAWQARPVFQLDFNAADYTRTGALDAKLDIMLSRLEERWDVRGRTAGFGDRLLQLLETAHEVSGHRCAVLVDEYDKPLIECVDNPMLEERNRAALKGFYGALKSADELLRFVFMTGVTKFSKVSIFSDLNQLRDVSLVRGCAGVCGFTEAEVLDTFGPELDALATQMGWDENACLEALRNQYDGYCFHPDGPGTDKSNMVYNPFSLLSALRERRLGSYWFQPGTPTFLVARIRDAGLSPNRLTDGSIYATEGRLSDYRVDDPDPVPLLYQTGYLTIRRYDQQSGRYVLAVPNGEVEWGLLQSLLPTYAPSYGEARGTDVFSLLDLVESGDAEGIRRILAALFASIPYTRDANPFENYFQAVIWLTFTLLGRYVTCEVHQAHGRVDCVIEAEAHVYVLEFKRDGTAAEALAQIDEKGYALPFAADPRELHVIGCSFDSQTRLLADWQER